MIIAAVNQVNDQASARKFMELRDLRVSRGLPVDRITEKFVGFQSGSWRSKWTEYAYDGHELDKYVAAEDEASCCACLNDSFNESPHSLMNTTVTQKGSRARPSLRFAMNRFQQAIEF